MVLRFIFSISMKHFNQARNFEQLRILFLVTMDFPGLGMSADSFQPQNGNLLEHFCEYCFGLESGCAYCSFLGTGQTPASLDTGDHGQSQGHPNSELSDSSRDVEHLSSGMDYVGERHYSDGMFRVFFGDERGESLLESPPSLIQTGTQSLLMSPPV